jgi:hypothetical protein
MVIVLRFYYFNEKEIGTCIFRRFNLERLKRYLAHAGKAHHRIIVQILYTCFVANLVEHKVPIGEMGGCWRRVLFSLVISL